MTRSGRRQNLRRNIGHDEAVQESFSLQKQFRSMWSDTMTSSPIELNEILRTLAKKKIPFVLTGAQAIGGWTGRPRATHEVDILVKGRRNHARAVKAIKALYPTLEVRDFAGVTAFFVPGEKQSVMDVTYPVWSGGGGKEILRLVERVKAGEAIDLDVTGKFRKRPGG